MKNEEDAACHTDDTNHDSSTSDSSDECLSIEREATTSTNAMAKTTGSTTIASWWSMPQWPSRLSQKATVLSDSFHSTSTSNIPTTAVNLDNKDLSITTTTSLLVPVDELDALTMFVAVTSFWDAVAPDLVSLLLTGRDMDECTNTVDSDDDDDEKSVEDDDNAYDSDSDAISLVYGCAASVAAATAGTTTARFAVDDNADSNHDHSYSGSDMSKRVAVATTAHINRLHTLVHGYNVQDKRLLHSLAYLQWEESLFYSIIDVAETSIQQSMTRKRWTTGSTRPKTQKKQTQRQRSRHSDAVQCVASFLVDPSIGIDAKLAGLSVVANVLVAFVPHDALLHSDDCLRSILAFCVAPLSSDSIDCGQWRQQQSPVESPYPATATTTDTSNTSSGTVGPSTLLWELRAVCLYLPTINVDHDNDTNGLKDASPDVPTNKLVSWLWLSLSITSRQRRQACRSPWESVKQYLYETNAVLLCDLDVLHQAYQGDAVDNASRIQNAIVLASMGYLRIEQRVLVDTNAAAVADGDSNGRISNCTLVDHGKHQEAVRNVATFLMDGTVSHLAKVKCLRCLSVVPEHAVLANSGEVMSLEEALAFCTNPRADAASSFIPKHDDAFLFLLWELRAICVYLWQLQEEHHARIMTRVARLSDSIIAGSLTVEAGLDRAAALATAGMSSASRYFVKHTPVDQSPWLDDDRKSKVVTLTYSDAMKRATTQTRLALGHILTTVRNVSARSIVAAAQQCSQWIRLPKSNVNPGRRVVVDAAGELTLATLGAASVVGEALASCAATLVQGAVSSARIVVSHKYGSTAGQVVQDVGDTAGNLLQIERNVAALLSTTNPSGSATRAVTSAARHTGRERARSQQKLGPIAHERKCTDSTDSVTNVTASTSTTTLEVDRETDEAVFGKTKPVQHSSADVCRACN